MEQQQQQQPSDSDVDQMIDDFPDEVIFISK